MKAIFHAANFMNASVFVTPRRVCGPAALLLALTVAFPSGCAKPAPFKLSPPALPPRSVSVATVSARNVPVYLNAEGQTTALQSVDVVAQVSGQIVEMPFTQGSMVKKGDKLAVIFQDPYIAAVKKAEGQLNIDEANLKLAQDTLSRNEQLLAVKAISQQQIDTYNAQIDALKGQIEVDQALLKTAQINLDYTTITAPVDGMVGTYRINVGNIIKANDLALTTIQTMDPIYADFVVSESDFPTLRQYFDTNGGKLKVHVISLANSTIQGDGELDILGNAIAIPTGTVSLRATVPNPNLQFWPNQPVQVRILLDTLQDAVVVPESAVLLSQQGDFVFVVGKPTTPGGMPVAEMRLVKTGPSQDDGTKVITDGLKPGEQVVVEGQIFLAPSNPLIIAELDGKPTAAALEAAPASSAGSASGASSATSAGSDTAKP